MFELDAILDPLGLDPQDAELVQKVSNRDHRLNAHFYLPMQNLEKISPSNSSEWISPVSRPRQRWAHASSSAARSVAPSLCRRPLASSRYPDASCRASICRLLARNAFSSSAAVPAASRNAAIRSGSPAPVSADMRIHTCPSHSVRLASPSIRSILFLTWINF